MRITYLREYAPAEILEVKDVSYDAWEDIFILQLEDYTTLFASYIEKTADGWRAGLPENY